MSNSNEISVDYEHLPRKGSVIFNFHYQNGPSKQKTLKRWKKINKYLMVPLYRIKLLTGCKRTLRSNICDSKKLIIIPQKSQK